jgi:hypothetical protein
MKIRGLLESEDKSKKVSTTRESGATKSMKINKSISTEACLAEGSAQENKMRRPTSK